MAGDWMQTRWRGQRNRKEIWYTTISDPQSGTGLWFHHELVSPAGEGTPYTHGFVAIFPSGVQPQLVPFGPAAKGWSPEEHFTCEQVELTLDNLRGRTDGAHWELSCRSDDPPLFTFPQWAWRTNLLPAAHMVPIPAGRFSGVVQVGERVLRLKEAPGATGRIFGHGMARQWAWLHADLGDGDVLEIVVAQARRLPWRLLPPMAFVRLRLDCGDWPDGDSLLASRRFRVDLGSPNWNVSGKLGRRRLAVSVRIPSDRAVEAPFTDPDGSSGVCHNSERADVDVQLTHRVGDEWQAEREWHLAGTAHAEVGMRPE